MAPPAYIFVVRHGNRLDAADKQWHVSSPTPYDPPLTYSGWAQSRTVGVKISDILKERAAEYEATHADNPKKKKKKKRFRIVIHSSPFLRCIQTSIAISTGLLTRPSLVAIAHRNLSPAQIAAANPDSSGQSRSSLSRSRRTSSVGRKIVLRIDAFLGEWLSPSYFELITPPPGSMMMLASAKASLLKHEDYSKYPHFQPRVHSNSTANPPSAGHLWGGSGNGLKPSPATLPSTVDEDPAASSALESLDSIERSLPMARSNSRTSNASEASQSSRGPTLEPTEIGAYDAPVPSFSLSKSAPIPLGYVNHAKDHCVIVDYQWDSMRAPYDWGDGGELPEDWPDMHRRFRKGLQEMVDWYTAADDPTSAVTTEYIKPGTNDQVATEDDEEEEETVVIIVSHGAGCNAMIGAITHQPVLIDVPISSLTMATLNKPAAPAGSDSSPLHKSHSVRMFASTDHLRSATPTPSSSRSSSLANVFGGSSRGRNSNSFSSPLSSTQPQYTAADGHRSSSANASTMGSLGSIRRSLQNAVPIPAAARPGGGGGSMAGAMSSSFTPSGLSRTPSIGLWSPAATKQQQDEECIEDDEDVDMLIDFGRENRAAVMTNSNPGSGASVAGAAIANGTVKVNPSSTSPSSNPVVDPEKQPGSSSLVVAADGDTDVVRGLSASKRRWTVNERP